MSVWFQCRSDSLERRLVNFQVGFEHPINSHADTVPTARPAGPSAREDEKLATTACEWLVYGAQSAGRTTATGGQPTSFRYRRIRHA
jgi:hypothetical protein